MSFRDNLVTSLTALFLTPIALLGVVVGHAQVRESASYKIESDSINFGGGLSTSTNYVLESTAGEVGTGESESTNFKLKAGYQQMVSTYIAMTSPDDVTMTPDIDGVVGGTSNGSTTVTVTTDSSAGYTMSIQAGESPAMRSGGNTIPDYAPSGGNPDYTFTILSDQAYFGYTPEGADTVTRFRDNGSACGTGGTGEVTLACWDGLSTSAETISGRGSANTPNGSTTTIRFRVGVGGGVNQAPGVYTATTTLTALSL